jgi:hypothetical protein
MISRPTEGLPWLNPADRVNLAHDRVQPDEEDDTRKHYFGPSKYYCVEIACAPCGTVIAWTKFDRSESPNKILKFLEDIFSTPESRPSFICIDKACQVFRTAIVNKSFATTWANTRFIVDTYHYNNHKQSDELCKTWCNPTPTDGSNPNLVVLEADVNGAIRAKRAFNTQASEQLNAWVASYHSILKRMTISNFNWLLHVMLFLHTKHIIQKQQEKEEKAKGFAVIDSEDEDEDDITDIDVDI